MRNFTFNKNKMFFRSPKMGGIFLLYALLANTLIFSQTTLPFTAPGTTSWSVPANVTAVQVECWGGGGAGGGVQGGILQTRVGGGGAGGAYTRNNSFAVTPAANISLTVGAGGLGAINANGGNGSASNFSTVTALGGAGGTRGTGTIGAGAPPTIGGTWNGGAGGTPTGTGNAGAGGGGAGSTGSGGNAAGATAGAAGAGGGGVGATGGNGNTGNSATALGGGGAGARTASGFSAINGTGGSGFRGQVLVTYRIFTLTSTTLSNTTCAGSASTVTANAAVASNLPVGSYTVTYTMSGTNTGSGSATMTVVSAGAGTTGTFTTSTLANPGLTTITINNITLTGSYGSNVVVNNSATIDVQTPTISLGSALLSDICRGGTSGALGVGALVGGTATGGTWEVDVPLGTINNASDIVNATWTSPSNFVGTATFTLKTTGGSCGSVSATKTLEVKAPSFTTAPAANTCLGVGNATYTTQDNQSNYSWLTPGSLIGIDYTIVSGGGAGDNQFVVTWLTTGAKEVTVAYTDVAAGCTATPTSNITTVSALPTIYTVSGNATICQGDFAVISLDGSETNVSYQLKNSAGDVNVGSLIAGTGAAINNWSTGPLSGTIKLYVVATNVITNCSERMTGEIDIVVTPAPVVDAITITSACTNSGTAAVAFTSSAAGTAFSWTNNNIAIGLPTNGTGDIASFTATNTTNAPIVGTITVSGNNGCPSLAPQKTFTITVNPTPDISNKTLSQCSGLPFTRPMVNVVDGIVPANTTYAWPAPAVPSGITGEAAGSNAMVFGGTLVNSTSGPIDVIYTVTPTSPTGSCPGNSFTVTVTVNPRPVPSFDAQPGSSTCVGNTVSYTTQTGGGISNYVWTYTGSGTTGVTGLTTNSISLNWTTGGATGTVTVNYTDGNGCVGSAAVPSTPTLINARPVIPAYNPVPAVTCTGIPVTYTTVAGMTNYVWGIPFAIGTYNVVSDGQSTENTITVQWLTTGNKNVTVNYTDVNGCTAMAARPSGNISPTTPPASTWQNSPGEGSSQCANSAIRYRATDVTGGTWAWTIQGTVNIDYTVTGSLTGRDISITWLTAGPKTVSVIVSNASCSATSPLTRTITVYEIPVASADPTASICSGDEIELALSSNTAGSTFNWSRPNVIGLTFSLPNGATGTTNPIRQTITNNSANTVRTVTYTATTTANGCTSTGVPILVTVYPRPTITAASVTAKTICNNTNVSIAPAASVPSSFTWSISSNPNNIDGATNPGSGASITDILNNPDDVNRSITYSIAAVSDANNCVGPASTSVITVRPTPRIINTTTTADICSGTALNIGLMASATSTFAWTANLISGSATFPVTGSGNTLNQIITNNSDATPAVVEYVVTPTLTGTPTGCAGTPTSFIVTVNPRPTVTATVSSKAICNGGNTDIALTSTSGASFTWTVSQFSGSTIGVTSGGTFGTKISDVLTNPTNNADGIVKYTVTPSGVGGCAGTPYDILVTVHPTPEVTNSNAKTICNNSSVDIDLTASVASTFSWTTANVSPGITGYNPNSNPLVTKINDVLSNSGLTTGTIDYMITPTTTVGGCLGVPYTITVTVNPTALVTNATLAVPLCSATPPIALGYTITSNVAGATYNWTRMSKVGITQGTVTDQTSNPIMETLENTTGGPIDVTYNLTALINGCPGPIKDLVVTVQPPTTAIITSSTSPIEICTGGVVNYNITSDQDADPAVSLRWSRALVTDITNPAELGSYTNPINETLVSLSNAEVSVTYLLNAMKNGCPGLQESFVVRVAPNLVINNQSFDACSGQPFTFAPTNAPPADIIPSNTLYKWGNPVVTGGITGFTPETSGIGAITQTLTNPTSTIQTATYSVGASAVGACVGGFFTLTINVKPTPNISYAPVGDQLICSGNPITPVTLSSTSGLPGTTFSWTRDNTAVVTGTSSGGGTGVPAVILTHGLSTQKTSIFTFKATSNGCSSTLPMTVNVDPRALATISPATQQVCSDNAIQTIGLTSSVSTATFNWSRNDIPAQFSSVDIPVSDVSTSIDGTFVNNTNVNRTVTFTVDAVASGCGGPSTATVIIKPSTLVTASPATQTKCSGEAITNIAISSQFAARTQTGTIYSWTRDNNLITGLETGTGTTISGTLVNTTNTQQTTVFTITALSPNGCTTTTTASVTLNPAPLISAVPSTQNVCSGFAITSINITDQNSLGSTFSWTVAYPPGLSGIANGSSSSIAATLTNTTTGSLTANFTITANGGGCGNILVIPVTVYPPVTTPLVVGESQSLCNSSNPIAFNIKSGGTGGNGFTYQWQQSNTGANVWGTAPGVSTNASYTAPRVDGKDYRLIATSSCGTILTSNNVVTINLIGQNIGTISHTPNHLTGPITAPICSGVTDLVTVTSGLSFTPFAYAWTASPASPVNTPTGQNGEYNIVYSTGKIGGDPGLTYTNTTSGQINTLITVTPKAFPFFGSPCSDDPFSYRVYINPIPIASKSVATETICSGGGPTAFVTSNITDNVPTSFGWSRQNLTTLAIGTGNSGDIARGSSFTLPGTFTNNTATPQIERFTITPTSRTCSGVPIVIDITVNPAPTAGTIAGDQKICGSTEDPAPFTSVILASGLGTPQYQWESKVGSDCTGTFTLIAGETNETLDIPAGLTATTTYRRRVTFVGTASCLVPTPSNCVTIYVNSVNPGSITGNQAFCTGSVPTPLGGLGSVGATGPATASITYQWQSSTGDCSTGTFNDITGETNATLSFVAGPTVTTTYRRVAISTITIAGPIGNSFCTNISNCVTVTVNSVTSPGAIDGGLTNCGSTNPAGFTEINPGTGTGAISYQWQKVLGDDCNLAFTDISGEVFNTYDASNLTATTSYRRVTLSTIGISVCSAPSACVTVKILGITAGSISGNRAVCSSGGSPAPFTSPVNATGTSVTYLWQISSDNVGWSPAPGVNDQNVYTAPTGINATTYFRRQASSTEDMTPCDVWTPSVTVQLNDVEKGTLTTPTCSSINPSSLFTETVPAAGGGGSGILTYQWQTAPSCGGTWSDISGGIGTLYTPSPLGAGTFFYRRKVISTILSTPCFIDGDCITVNTYGGTSGDWTGTNGTDWFNCGNWGSGVLPTSAMDVTIPFAPANQPQIADNSPFDPGGIARAKNLNVDGTVTFTTPAANLNVVGNLVIGATGNVSMTGGGTFDLAGNWTNSRAGGGLTGGTGTVNFIGTAAQQTITTLDAFEPMYNLNINNANGVRLDAPVKVSGNLGFINGLVENTVAMPLTVAASGTATGGSNASFVNGPLAKETDVTTAGSQEFMFPVGKAPNNYQPAGVLPVTASGTTTYVGEFFSGNPGLMYNGFFADPFLSALLSDKYWIVDRPSGTGTGRVILNYTSTPASGWRFYGGTVAPPSIPYPTNVAVAHYTGTAWHFTKGYLDFDDVQPLVETISYLDNGPIHTNVMASFSPFTIGFGSGIILPIKLISFEGRLLNTDGALSWKIDNNTDLAGFELEYSTNGTSFKKLADIAASNSTVYGYLDKQLPAGSRFYRLLVKEKNGNRLYSPVIVLTLDGQRTTITGLTSTIISQQSVTGKIFSAKAQGIRALISDVSGRQIAERRGRLQAGSNQWLIGTGFLAQGMYFVTIVTDDGVKATLQFVKE